MEAEKIEWAKQFAEMGKDIAMTMGHNEFIPTLFYRDTEGKTTIVGMMGVPTGHMYDAVLQVLKTALNGTFEMIALTCDAYSDMHEMEGITSDEEFQAHLAVRVGLETRFLAGDSNVKECLNTLVMSADGVITVNQSYKWTPVDGWEWDEPRVIDDGTSDWEWDRIIAGLPRKELSFNEETS